MEEQIAAEVALASLDLIKKGVDLIEGNLMPLAKVAKVYPPDMTAAMIVEQAKGHLRRPATPPHQSPVVQAARNYIQTAAVLVTLADARLEVCRLMVRQVPNLSLDELEALEFPDFEGPQDEAADLCFVALGYLQAMVAMNKQRSEPASNARKNRGDNKREELRAAVGGMKPGRSKEAAALDLSEELALSVGRVRRLLIEEFPGAAWPGKK